MFFKKLELNCILLKFKKEYRVKKAIAKTKKREALAKKKIKNKFKLALRHAQKTNSIATAQLHYLEAKILDADLCLALENIFFKHLKKINDPSRLDFYLKKLLLAESLKIMVQEKLTILQKHDFCEKATHK